MHTDVTNFIQNTSLIASSGQPTREQLGAISAAGYEAVVNLAMPNHELAIADEGAIVAGWGGRYLHLPVPFDNPSVDDAKLFCHTMRGLHGKKVWVHCILNYRASAFLYHYFSKVEGLPEAVARSEMFDTWQPDNVWQAFLALTRAQLDLSPNLSST